MQRHHPHAKVEPAGSADPPAPAHLAFETRDEAVKLQYELLGILDSKASALLTFDALALASLSIWLGYIPLNYMHLALDVAFLIFLASCIALLIIIWLRWANQQDDEERLNATRVLRTTCYRVAWRLSLAGMICIVLVSLVHTWGTTLIATDHCSEACRVFYSEGVFGNFDYRE